MDASDARWLLILSGNLGYQIVSREPWDPEPPGVIGRFQRKADAQEVLDALPDRRTAPLFDENDW